jgi:hypothetical protein
MRSRGVSLDGSLSRAAARFTACDRGGSQEATARLLRELATSNPPNPRADEDRDGALSLGKGGMIVGPWRISQVVLFNLFARTAKLRESLF